MADSPGPDAHDAEQPDPVGLECAYCGCRDWRVWRTRQRLDVIVRERRCRHCGKPTFTREVIRTKPGA